MAAFALGSLTAVPAGERAADRGLRDRPRDLGDRLAVRKASFLATDEAVRRSGMEYCGITPLGLPADWPILLDADVVPQPTVLIMTVATFCGFGALEPARSGNNPGGGVVTP